MLRVVPWRDRVLLSALVLATLSASCTRYQSATQRSATAASSTAASSTVASAARGPSSSGALPHYTSRREAARRRWRHVIVVVEENHSYGEIIGNRSAPYLNHLARAGVSFSRFRAITHPSEPNYLALFSGSRHRLTDDSCPHRYVGGNLGAQLRAAGSTFVGYSETLPFSGFTGCTFDSYVRRHTPWVNFANLPKAVNLPLRRIPTDFSRLPSVAFVIPNLRHDMHDGTVRRGDDWLWAHLRKYATWTAAHRSLLVVTWDEDDRSASNHIPTIAVGAGVRHGVSAQRATLYSLLRTIEDGFGLRHLHAAASAPALRALASLPT